MDSLPCNISTHTGNWNTNCHAPPPPVATSQMVWIACIHEGIPPHPQYLASEQCSVQHGKLGHHYPWILLSPLPIDIDQPQHPILPHDFLTISMDVFSQPSILLCEMQISPPPTCTIALLTLYGHASHKFPIIYGTWLQFHKLWEIYRMHAHIK